MKIPIIKHQFITAKTTTTINTSPVAVSGGSASLVTNSNNELEVKTNDFLLNCFKPLSIKLLLNRINVGKSSYGPELKIIEFQENENVIFRFIFCTFYPSKIQENMCFFVKTVLQNRNLISSVFFTHI